jgi:hypothetical protein
MVDTPRVLCEIEAHRTLRDFGTGSIARQPDTSATLTVTTSIHTCRPIPTLVRIDNLFYPVFTVALQRLTFLFSISCFPTAPATLLPHY